MRWSVRCGQERRQGGGSGKQFVIGTVLETGGVGLTQGHMGKSQGSQEAEEGVGEHLSHELYWGFHGKDKAGQDGQLRAP